MKWHLFWSDAFLVLQVGGIVVLSLTGFMGIVWLLAQLIGEMTAMLVVILASLVGMAILMLLSLGIGLRSLGIGLRAAMRRYRGAP